MKIKLLDFFTLNIIQFLSITKKHIYVKQSIGG
jgi:hypothetical protein